MKPRLDAPRVAALILVVAVVFSLPVLQPAGRQLDYAANLSRFLARFWPPDFSVLPQVLPSLWETFQMAILASAAAALLGVPLAAAASRTIAPRLLVSVIRLGLSLIRAIPGLIWALIAVAVLGANPGAGVVALVIYSLGYLGKFFSDAFESADPAVSQALRATGAHADEVAHVGLELRRVDGLEAGLDQGIGQVGLDDVARDRGDLGRAAEALVEALRHGGEPISCGAKCCRDSARRVNRNRFRAGRAIQP